MHYLPLGARLNKDILMVTQLIQGFSYKRKERETGLEPATPTLARSCSTN